MKVEGDTQDILNRLVTCQNKQLYHHLSSLISKDDFKFKDVNYLVILYLMQKWLDDYRIGDDGNGNNDKDCKLNINMSGSNIVDDGLDGLLNKGREDKEIYDNGNHEVINEDDYEFLNTKTNGVENKKDIEDLKNHDM